MTSMVMASMVEVIGKDEGGLIRITIPKACSVQW